MTVDWADILSLMNVVLAGIGAYFALMYVYQHPRPFSWLKLLYGLIGLYWCGLYVYILITDVMDIPRIFGIGFGEILVRPAFTFTLGAMAAGAIWRMKTGKP